jgi:hypothetical protein
MKFEAIVVLVFSVSDGLPVGTLMRVLRILY